jgi:release factor glutamine methyltransferase
MAFVLGRSRASLLGHLDDVLPESAAERFHGYVSRRCTGEPIAYMRNVKEFLGREFYVDSRVLIPRPETELLVERAIAWLAGRADATVVDIGTGSGAIAVSVALAAPPARVIATDLSADALDVARRNAGELGATIDFRQGSLLEPVTEQVDLVLANLPYLTANEMAAGEGTSIAFEPRLALDGGPDGLDPFRALFGQMRGRLKPDGAVLLEIGSGQAEAVVTLAETDLPELRATVLRDLAGLPRVVELTGR